jgi:hypothetical protein
MHVCAIFRFVRRSCVAFLGYGLDVKKLLITLWDTPQKFLFGSTKIT